MNKKKPFNAMNNVLILPIIIFLILTSAPQMSSATHIYRSSLGIVFAESDTNNIVVRTSDTGVVWNDRNFNPDFIRDEYQNDYLGLSISGESDGLFNMVVTQVADNTLVNFGLGDSWDNRPKHERSLEAITPFATAFFGEDLLLLAFIDDSLDFTLSVYDIRTPQSFVILNAYTGNLGQNVIPYRPAVAVNAVGSIVVAWIESVDGITSIVSSVGTQSTYGFSFGTARAIPFLAPEGSLQPASLDATSDGETFYLSYLVEQPGGPAGSLHGWDTYLMSSEDGSSWSDEGRIFIDTRDDSIVRIAAITNGTLIATSIKALATSTTIAEIHASTYEPSVGWSHMSNPEDVFGATTVGLVEYDLVSLPNFHTNEGENDFPFLIPLIASIPLVIQYRKRMKAKQAIT